MKLTVRETAIFGMLGALMYASKMIMEFAPNIHLLGVFTIAFTVVYRKKALYPIYIFILLLGILLMILPEQKKDTVIVQEEVEETEDLEKFKIIFQGENLCSKEQ